MGDMSVLSETVLEVIGLVGMTAAASGMVSGPKAASGDVFHFTNWPEAWLDLYMGRDFVLIDPIPRWARNSGRPVSWSELVEVLPDRDPGRQVIEAGAAFDFTEGYVMPMRAADNSLGAISFGGARGRFSDEEHVFLASVARSGFEAADRIENKGRPGRPSPILSAREIECLALLVRGHSDGEAARMLGLSVRTVRFHLSNARDKFDAATRTQLAALALAQGYVQL